MNEVRRYLQGQVVDERFPLIQYLGATEHSCVFLTEYADAENNRAAIKLIPAPPRSTEPMLTRWRLASRFAHPHLLRLYDAGRCTIDGAPMLYVVMEFAEENLGETLIRRPLSPAETHEMLCPVLDALGYIHGKGFVHGHVQPSNIMAIGDKLKLSSDRIARIGELPDRRNGNARYCAPEYDTASLSQATDVWSLGMTIVECLTERWADADRAAIALPADLPAPFSELARHCLNKSPRRRWDVPALKARLQVRSFALKQEAAISALAPARAPERKPEAKAKPAPTPVLAPAPVVRPEASAKLRRPLALIAATGVALTTVAVGVALHKHSSHATARAVAAEPPAAQTDVARARTSENAAPPAQAQPAPVALPLPSFNGRTSAVTDVVEAASVPPAPTPVKPASESTRGDVLHRAVPEVPLFASRTISGTVRVGVRVKVDPAGKVVAAELDPAGPSRYFARLSMEAAHEWKFAGAGPSEWLIRFNYSNSATTATAVQRIP